MTTLTVSEITKDERDYDNWLATLSQASERLDDLQTVVDELRELCTHGEVVRTSDVMAVLERHHAVA
ncbi:hypothetical protein [Mycobacterium paraterrae]|uniref:PH domain-containing protein n=1 Tax=Mycobacterium paraterrae TaxID=577492 RepID=A0ABY3VQ05_9MYCO|nr:hypothetical protein [Mycobacterium paraterrae]UMB71522.1 hypothetical protein MKK62_09920 [Mycobacterium paraterrae]